MAKNTRKKKLAYMIAAQTGRSYQGACNVLAAALNGEEWAKMLVTQAEAEMDEDRLVSKPK